MKKRNHNTTNLEKARKSGLKLGTKKDYVKAHRKLWDGIASMLKAMAANSPKIKVPRSLSILDVKEYVFEDLFGRAKISGLCFGCQWAQRKSSDDSCEKCLFKIEPGMFCLDGLYQDIEEAVRMKRLGEAVEIAKKIKNFKVRGRQ